MPFSYSRGELFHSFCVKYCPLIYKPKGDQNACLSLLQADPPDADSEKTTVPDVPDS